MRLIAFGIGVPMILSSGLGLLMVAQRAGSLYFSSSATALSFVVVSVVFMARSLRIGVWTNDANVVATEWFTSYSFQKSDISKSRAVRYYGFMSGGAETFVNMLELTFTDGSTTRLRGTIAPYRVSKTQAAELTRRISDQRPRTY